MNYTLDHSSVPLVERMPASEEEISAICADPSFPSPVRATGSGMSLTRCAEADGGTLLRLDRLKRIGEIDGGYIRVQAGVTFSELARHLEGTPWRIKGSDIGSATIGSLACCHSKTSFPFAQVSQEIGRMRLVLADGRIAEYSEADDPELFAKLRTSYGLLGVVTEVWYRLWPRVAYSCELKTLSMEDFQRRYLDSDAHRDEIAFFIIYPGANRVGLEIKREVSAHEPPTRWYSRTLIFELMGAFWGVCGACPHPPLRHWLSDRCSELFLGVGDRLSQVRVRLSAGQEFLPIVRRATPLTVRRLAAYSMPRNLASSWFPQYLALLRSYPETAHRYHPSYLVNAPDPSHFTLTPGQADHVLVDACVGFECKRERWEEISRSFDEFCRKFGGVPLFNQSSDGLTPADLERAYGRERVESFAKTRRAMDPHDRFLSGFFRSLLVSTNRPCADARAIPNEAVAEPAMGPGLSA